MVNKYLFLFIFITSGISGYSQSVFPTSMKFTYSGGNNMGAAYGNCETNKDIDIVFNTLDGVMELKVNKICNSWSFMGHWLGGSYAPKPVFKNRLIEMRIQSSAPHDTGLRIEFQVSGGSPDGSINKSIPPLHYKIHQANTWEIKFFKLQGNADTVFKQIDYFFSNGEYKIDYVYYGDAAVPPVPVMNPVSDQNNAERGTHHLLGLQGIEVPGRPYEGLIAEVKSENTGFFDSLYITGYIYWAVLHYKISKTSPLTSDNVTVTLKDTIRGTSSVYKFKITAAPLSLIKISEEVKVYPTLITNAVTIDFADISNARIDIIDMTGNILFTKNILNQSLETIDLSSVPQGIYHVKISKENTQSVRKIIKL